MGSRYRKKLHANEIAVSIYLFIAILGKCAILSIDRLSIDRLSIDRLSKINVAYFLVRFILDNYLR